MKNRINKPTKSKAEAGISSMDDLHRITERLEKLGRLQEILDGDGEIRPSPSAFERTENEHPDKSDAEKYRLAQAATLLELAEKYQTELN
jgi:hypothetical protein